jgi:hypothetical protein
MSLFLRFNRYQVNARVIVEESWVVASSNLGYSEDLLSAAVRTDTRGIHALDDREEYRWDKLPPTTPLTDQQAQLCPPSVFCVVIATGQRCIVSVNTLKAVDWNDKAMKGLVLDGRKKKLLTGLVKQHSKNKERHHSDLIQNKGRGPVIILHGPSGVGKTLTAESIAESVKKPLLSMSIGSLISDEDHMEDSLIKTLAKANRWDAILLMDEADSTGSSILRGPKAEQHCFK